MLDQDMGGVCLATLPAPWKLHVDESMKIMPLLEFLSNLAVDLDGSPPDFLCAEYKSLEST